MSQLIKPNVVFFFRFFFFFAGERLQVSQGCTTSSKRKKNYLFLHFYTFLERSVKCRNHSCTSIHSCQQCNMQFVIPQLQRMILLQAWKNSKKLDLILILQASQFTILITADTDVFTQESVSLITKKKKRLIQDHLLDTLFLGVHSCM